MKRLGLFVATASAALALAGAAHAATVVVNHVFDPANFTISNITGEALAVPVMLGVGDTLDLTITFAGGVGVEVQGEDGLWALLGTDDDGAILQTDYSLSFLGASSNLIPTSGSQPNQFVHLGPYVGSSNYRTDDQPIRFTGLRQIVTITSDDLGLPRTYDNVALTRFSGTVTTFTPGAIPEPTTWALMIGGFGLAGATLRRRQTLAA
jgi:hypothetical protein